MAYLCKALLVAALLQAVAATPGLDIPSTSGPLTGFIDKDYPNVRQFLGIPFAQPPLGSLRFQPPKPFTGAKHIDGTVTPPACQQYASNATSLYTYSAPGFLNQAPVSEDCLTLSVWSPTLECPAKDAKLPVLIFLYGGALQTGSSSVPFQQPPPWIQRTGSHLVVSIQYRLNIFGFPNAAALPPASRNPGLLDQRLGVEWVRNNIAAFGGDPSRMVLWGQSAGAASVDVYNFAYYNDTIVQGFMSDSGNALFPPGVGFFGADPAQTNFTSAAKAVGCPDASNPAGQLACMQKVDAKTLTNLVGTSSPPLQFYAQPDGQYVYSNYTARYAAGAVSHKPAVFGSNTNEGAAFAPFPANPRVMGPNETLVHELTHELIENEVIESVQARLKIGRQTFRYLYAGNFSNVSPLFWEGAYHSSELPQIFGTAMKSASAAENATRHSMQDLWLAFAKDPSKPQGWIDASNHEILLLGAGGGKPQCVSATDSTKAC